MEYLDECLLDSIRDAVFSSGGSIKITFDKINDKFKCNRMYIKESGRDIPHSVGIFDRTKEDIYKIVTEHFDKDRDVIIIYENDIIRIFDYRGVKSITLEIYNSKYNSKSLFVRTTKLGFFTGACGKIEIGGPTLNIDEGFNTEPLLEYLTHEFELDCTFESVRTLLTLTDIKHKYKRRERYYGR